ncbi:MAG: VCBS repeat-containing protein, partial [Spirochaetaceae bacterium]|nr:VCBS repeat-containing protein [Spirochaetaceae bacterium]
MAATAEVRLSTCAADPALCPEATGLIHPHAPAIDSFFTFSGGGSVGDFNRDGRQDLFLVTGGEEPDRLYLNQGDGTFREVAEAAGGGGGGPAPRAGGGGGGPGGGGGGLGPPPGGPAA